jgi:glutaconate CoA-transferase subunit A
MLEDELLAPGVISAVYVTKAVQAEKGAWPLGMPGVYGVDDAHLSLYAKAAKTREGFQRYLDEWLLTPRKSFSPA